MSERAPKTHPSQWAMIVNFVENHREMVTHQFVGLSGRENYNRLWNELTIQLNSMGFGKKDSKKWQEVFGKWRSKVKMKAQDIVCGLKKTGGGGPQPQLTEIEDRLMGIIGWKTVTGDENVELGVENSFVVTPSTATEVVESQEGTREELINSAQTEELNLVRDVYLEVPTLIPLVSTSLVTPSSTRSRTPPNSVSRPAPSKTFSLVRSQTPLSSTNRLKPSTASSSMIPQTPLSSTKKQTAASGLEEKKRKRQTPQERQQKSLTDMHNEHLAMLSSINNTLQRIADNQEINNKLLLEFLEITRSKMCE